MWRRAASSHLILGAHSAGGLHKIVAALGSDSEVGARFRSLPLILVSHRDGPGGAGEQAEQKVRAEVARLNMTMSVFDLGPNAADLNDWLLLRKAGTSR